MDRARHRSSLSSERFLGSFLPSAAFGDLPTSAAFELDEDDLFDAGSGSPEPPQQPARRPLILSAVRSANPRPLPSLRRLPEGILDALPEHRRSPQLSSSSKSSSLASPPPAPTRMIPVVPRPEPAPGPDIAQSAPVNVPVARIRKPLVVPAMCEADEEEDEEMLPPHEMVARARARESPMTTFSMLEGAGRTLKGRDLRQVRNAVWRQTGFLD
jgi:hypothetical protein